MRFEVGQLAILNDEAVKGLPNRVGECVEIIQSYSSPNYDYMVELDDGDIVPVRDKELNVVTEEQLQLMTYIKRGNKVVYAPLNEEVEIVKCDFLHGHIEVKTADNAMVVVEIEKLKPIEGSSEGYKYSIGDRVRDKINDEYGVITSRINDDGENEYGVELFEEDEWVYRHEEDLELYEEEAIMDEDKYQETINGHTKEYWLDLFFGHYDNGDGSYTVPKDLLHNLLDKLI